ncbi:MAG: DUF4252 domain-containing protein [Ignavibacteria bacterium]|nr:DUF4252 domain-containing protein [Ignavibacteria bacterium]
MKTKSIILFAVITFFLVTLTGCIGVNRQFSEIKNKIMGDLGDDYKTEFQFSVGSSLIHVSSWFVDLAADEEYVDDMIREISSVQVGVYNRIEDATHHTSFSTLNSIDEEMNSNGWKYLVRTIDRNELTTIYISADPEELLKKMFIINLNDDELVIVEVNGDLKKVITYAIEERNFNLKM